MAHEQADTRSLITRFLESVGTRDAQGVEDLFAETVDWNVAGDTALPWIGPRTSRSHIANYFHTMWSQFAGPGTATVHNILIDGGSGVVFATIGNASAATGRPFETPVAMHFYVQDGKITRMHLYEVSWAVSNAFQ